TARVSREAETFAHKYEPNSVDGIDYIGVSGVPRWSGRPPMGLVEEDGINHAELRRVLNPLFAPGIVELELEEMQAVATWFMDLHIESGSMDLVRDFANPIPAVITLRRMGLPIENWALWSHTMHAVLAFSDGSPEQLQAAA